MHSLTNELLNMKACYLSNSPIMQGKRKKLKQLSRQELVQVDEEIRAELHSPWITDVLHSENVTKDEIAEDILYVLTNSVINNFKTICNGK